jgi:hypothetical protein
VRRQGQATPHNNAQAPKIEPRANHSENNRDHKTSKRFHSQKPTGDKPGTWNSGPGREASGRTERRGKSTSRGPRDNAGHALGASRDRSRGRKGDNTEEYRGNESRKAIYDEDVKLGRNEPSNHEGVDGGVYYGVSPYMVDGVMKLRLINRQKP